MIAAIDIGSNGIRLVIASVHRNHRTKLVEDQREAVRLGHDVFTKGIIKDETINRVVKVFEHFHDLLNKHRVKHWRAVATSAMREARNRDKVIARVTEATGINISIINGEEEARLVYLAVANKINLSNKAALIIEIGGGSVELTMISNGQITSTKSFRIGAVRLLRQLEQPGLGEQRFSRLTQEYVNATCRSVKKVFDGQKIDLCIATGGNVESLGDLRRLRFRKDNNSLK